ncbi:hypothetical protein J437_LFUL008140 [Ladona fulva]|uniref:DNA-directed DNA polymerase n=1 Tax=Ladona fulva TaxID=123851 RepID=A0A8K0NV25_LADFU|nr:hypothetical protein J437_LFUL008140 [Ladona fulva]
MNGTKILSISYDGLRFVDSLNFLLMALSKLPSALGLGESPGKGYFPHFFNRRENADYRGPLPTAEMYGIDSISSKEREDFLTWHGEMSKTHILDMKTCGQDVRILSSACLRFREIFLASTGVDPFREAVAVASACMRVFRMRFLKPDTIAIIPPGGYRLANQGRHHHGFCGRRSRETYAYSTRPTGGRHVSWGRRWTACGRTPCSNFTGVFFTGALLASSTVHTE